MIYAICNPTAGSGRGEKIGQQIKQALDKKGVISHLVLTKRPGHAEELARGAREEGRSGARGDRARPRGRRGWVVVDGPPSGPVLGASRWGARQSPGQRLAKVTGTNTSCERSLLRLWSMRVTMAQRTWRQSTEALITGEIRKVVSNEPPGP